MWSQQETSLTLILGGTLKHKSWKELVLLWDKGGLGFCTPMSIGYWLKSVPRKDVGESPIGLRYSICPFTKHGTTKCCSGPNLFFPSPVMLQKSYPMRIRVSSTCWYSNCFRWLLVYFHEAPKCPGCTLLSSLVKASPLETRTSILIESDVTGKWSTGLLSGSPCFYSWFSHPCVLSIGHSSAYNGHWFKGYKGCHQSASLAVPSKGCPITPSGQQPLADLLYGRINGLHSCVIIIIFKVSSQSSCVWTKWWQRMGELTEPRTALRTCTIICPVRLQTASDLLLLRIWKRTHR